MKKLLKSSLVAIAAAGCLGGAQAASTIQFDMNGAAPGGLISVDTFDWAPDNGLIVNGANPAAAQPLTVNAQGSLATFIKAGSPATFTSPLAGTEYTFVLSMLETATGIGTGSVALTPISGTISLYYDPTADANQLAGTGYDNGTLILMGSVVGGSGSFNDLTVALPGLFPTQDLDQFNANDYPGIVSDQGSGSTALNIDVTFADPSFFKSNVTSLVIDLQDSTNNTTPFKQADPAALVGGVAPVFTGGTVNGAPGTCLATGQTRCDFLIQTDASSTFNPTPEPGSLALLGLALGALGWSARRRSA